MKRTIQTAFSCLIIMSLFLLGCHAKDIETGAEQTESYIPLIKNKRVGVVVNQTSIVNNKHLVDTLITLDINIETIFGPEHGFRGDADAGEKVDSNIDSKTGKPIISLYGKNKKPTPEQVKNIDVIIFDIQDVGVRFYTYISTMHYIMEVCAENNIPLIILDRPNPNGDYISGPILKPEFKSFIGMHPIPIVHGMTVGELAQMINGEGWLDKNLICDLTVIPVKNWTHATKYELPVKPSPNLPNYQSIRLYPSLCFFEATNISIGRGTTFPFQIIGSPIVTDSLFSFTPISISGMSKYPKHKNIECHGSNLQNIKYPRFTLRYLINFLKIKGHNINRPDFFNLLAGNDTLIQQVKSGLSYSKIEESWQSELDKFDLSRKKYLIYREN